MPEEFVLMTNPKVHTGPEIEPGHASREAFDLVWSKKGWEIYEEPAPAAVVVQRPPVTPPASVGATTKES